MLQQDRSSHRRPVLPSHLFPEREETRDIDRDLFCLAGCVKSTSTRTVLSNRANFSAKILPAGTNRSRLYFSAKAISSLRRSVSYKSVLFKSWVYIFLLSPPKRASAICTRILQKNGENYTRLATGLCPCCGVFFPPPGKHACQKITIPQRGKNRPVDSNTSRENVIK
jgi:hypothetical protein